VPGIAGEADLILALDVEDMQSLLPQSSTSRSVPVINVSLANLKLRAWTHDYQAMVPAARHITASADCVVEALLNRLHEEPLPAPAVAARHAEYADRIAAARRGWAASAASATADGAVPLDRVLYELSGALDGTDFVLGGGTNGRHEHKYLPLTRARQYTGWAAGGGLGYGVGGALGTALAQAPGTITVDVQADGDLLFLPSALWTAAHRSLPVLVIVNNNRQYGNTVEHAGKIARRRGHSDANHGERLRYVGAGLADPPVDLAGLARSFGVWAAGPISDAETLAESLAQAIKVVSSGKPALLDVLTPGF
jgi:thiamine pyrophosphate-dependent acetolactate synthase large subunit-like protein